MTSLYKKSGVYALIDPKTNLVRYVGRSVNIGARFNAHKKGKKNLPVSIWIRSLANSGLLPKITVLEFHDKPEDIEAAWIKHYKDNGQADLNLHDGGKGLPMAGSGRCDEVWSIEGLSCPFPLMIRSLFHLQNHESGKRVVRYWTKKWTNCKTELDRISVLFHCFQVVQRLGNKDLQKKCEEWAIAAAPVINAKYPRRVTLVYNDGIEETP